MGQPALDDMGVPGAETKRRIAAVRQGMADRGLEALLVFSSPGSLRFGERGHVLYLSGHEPYFGDCMMILPRDEGAEAVLMKDAADYFPQRCTWIGDVRDAGDRVRVVREFLSVNQVGSENLLHFAPTPTLDRRAINASFSHR
jgi:hypothetical protein